ncbi:hypothetical protein R6Q57_026432 [Mikania cordata]
MFESEESQVSAMEKGNTSLIISTDQKIHLAQKMIAEFIGTFCVIFAGCGSVAVNNLYGGAVTFPGVCVTWGLIVMAMIYTVGHVSGAHFNPAVTITLSLLGLCPFKEVAVYIVSQLSGSILASGILSLIMNIKKHGGIVVGMSIMLNVFVAGPISGASMNPVRSLGPAIVKWRFKGIWAYIFGPIIGAVIGGFVYNLLTPTQKSFKDIVKRSG